MANYFDKGVVSFQYAIKRFVEIFDLASYQLGVLRDTADLLKNYLETYLNTAEPEISNQSLFELKEKAKSLLNSSKYYFLKEMAKQSEIQKGFDEAFETVFSQFLNEKSEEFNKGILFACIQALQTTLLFGDPRLTFIIGSLCERVIQSIDTKN